MKEQGALTALAGLAHETRLAVFRLLVEAGPLGLAAGDIARELEVPSTTLSFHLRHLSNASLVLSERKGTSIRYAADFDAINGLVEYLTDKCCGGEPGKCAPVVESQSGVSASGR